MKKILCLSFLLAFTASFVSYGQKDQRTRKIGEEKFRNAIENYKPGVNHQKLGTAVMDGTILFSENFNDPALDLPAGWTKSGSSQSCSWNMDATPAVPGYFSAVASLNFNNGVDYNCDEGNGYGTWGTVISPAFDVFGQPCQVSFMFNLENECSGSGEGGPADAPTFNCGFDDTWMFIMDENENVIASYFIDGVPAWNQNYYMFDNVNHYGTIRIAFYFDSGDSLFNDFYGPFIDNLVVTQVPVTTPVADWALAIGIALIALFTFFRIRKQF